MSEWGQRQSMAGWTQPTQRNWGTDGGRIVTAAKVSDGGKLNHFQRWETQALPLHHLQRSHDVGGADESQDTTQESKE